MGSRLQDEIKQAKPFTGPEHEATVAIARTAAVLEHRFAEVLKPFGITPTQFNALRILRGAGPAGLCRNEVRDRLIARVPDATRLLDRLVDLGLIIRDRDSVDRRYVTARITAAGLELLDRIDPVTDRLNRESVGRMGPDKLARLIDLLAEARASSQGTE
ncbi:MAG: MarR family winged helix-turn-helix transcriptional regulator [Gemmatimonadales bacterium]|nr:winged helix-turn-helix transcriptional regulator [Gemmatimonadota bacterium]MDX2059121.1 MarR family winged helix-turn-helix transcriptional regulator [Gemmatimonadales bacterium]